MYIYKTTNIKNGKVYIGQHSRGSESYLGSGTLLRRAILKHGITNFQKEIIEECSTKKELNEREIYWINHFNSTDRMFGYNIAKGGDGGNTYFGKTSEEMVQIKDKISKSLTGKKAIWMANYKGEKSAKFKKLPMEDNEIIELYRKGESMNSIGKKLGVSKTKIKAILVTHNEPIRSTKESALVRPKPSDEAKQKMRNSHLGEKNHMYGKTLYEKWFEKYGEEEANKKMEEYKKIMSKSVKNAKGSC